MRDLQLKINDDLKKYVEDVKAVHNGVRYHFQFENGMCANVIKHDFSYGGDEDLWELAILRSDGQLYYCQLVNFDVLGYLTDKDVEILLKCIKKGLFNVKFSIIMKVIEMLGA